MLENYTPDQISAFWAGVTGITALVTGGIAIATLRALKNDSRDRSRPVVVAELLPITLSHGTSRLLVQNVGASVAKKVNVTFDPPITPDMGHMAAFIAKRFSVEIPTMGPGRRLENLYSRWRGDGSDKLDEAVPYDVSVSISYQDSRSRDYLDTYELSLHTLRNQTTTSPSSTDDKGMQKRLVQALEAIARGVNP